MTDYYKRAHTPSYERMAATPETTVVNVKVGSIRPAYQNLKEWMKDPNHVYIGRAGIVFVPTEDGGKERWPKKDSPWCNPFKIDKWATREDVIREYRSYIKAKIQDEGLNIEDLRGKMLGCWCKPEACHGDVLLELLNEAETGSSSE